MKRLILILLGVGLLLMGCISQLSVRVDILDREQFQHEPGVIAAEVEKAEFRIARHLENGDYNRLRGRFKKSARSAVDSLLSRSEIAHKDSAELMNTLWLRADQTFDEASKSHQAGLLAARQARVIQDSLKLQDKPDLRKRRQEFLLKARVHFDMGDATLQRFGISLDDFFKGYDIDFSAEIKKLIENTQHNITRLTEDAGLLDDTVASLVVYAPEKLWQGSYNKTFAKNVFGSSDIAIVMESLGHFTLKGVRLDASKALEASRKTLSQSIKFLAASYGVSTPRKLKIPAPGTEAEAGEFNFEIEELTTAERNKQEAESLRRLSRLAAISIMDAILAQRQALRNKQTFSQAVQTIRKTYEAYKPQLHPTLKGKEQ